LAAARIESFRRERGARGGVLLLHGFTGSPYEMECLADPLAEAGWSVVGVRFPGHGSPEETEDNTWPAWRATAEEALADVEAIANGGPTFVVGLSMGALIALELAARHPERLRGIVALSPAITLPSPLPALLGLAHYLPSRWRGFALPKGPSDIRDLEARARHPVSNPFPFSAILSFDELRRRAVSVAPSVRQPLLIVHARRDRTCPLEGASWLSRNVASERVEMHVLERSGHVIPVDCEGAEAVRLILGFLEGEAGPASVDRESGPR